MPSDQYGPVIEQTLTPKELADWRSRLLNPQTWEEAKRFAEKMLRKLRSGDAVTEPDKGLTLRGALQKLLHAVRERERVNSVAAVENLRRALIDAEAVLQCEDESEGEGQEAQRRELVTVLAAELSVEVERLREALSELVDVQRLVGSLVSRDTAAYESALRKARAALSPRAEPSA